MARKILGAGLIGMAVVCGYSERAMVSEYLNDTDTAREQLIESGILKAFGIAVDVRCVDKEKMGALFEPKIKGRAIPVLNMIWLNEVICQNLESFTNSPHKRLANLEQIDALGTTTHEVMHMVHVNLIFSEEGKMECYAGQVTYRLAEGFGADRDEAIRIGQSAAIQVRNDQSTLPVEYNITKECQPGSEYDLGDSLRIFP